MTEIRADGRPVARWGPSRLDLEIGVGQIVLGSMVATFAARLFAAVLARRARQDAPPTRAELRAHGPRGAVPPAHRRPAARRRGRRGERVAREKGAILGLFVLLLRLVLEH